MALYANATDMKKIHAGIASILARTKEKPADRAVVRVKAFHQSLGLNLPFNRFAAEVADAIRAPDFIAEHGEWGFCYLDEMHYAFVSIPNNIVPAVFDFSEQV